MAYFEKTHKGVKGFGGKNKRQPTDTVHFKKPVEPISEADLQKIEKAHSERSDHARAIDESLRAPLADSSSQWFNDPAHFDVVGVDAPEKHQNKEATEKQEKPKEETVKIEKPPVPKGTVEDSTATYNKATGWMAISFAGIPPLEVRQEMKTNGFRWNPIRKQWVAKWYPHREALAKKFAGSVEQVDIAPNWAAKAEHAAEMAAKHAQNANQTFNKAEKMADVIPFGQPILIDHYSARRDINYRNRIEKTYEKSFEEQKIADKYQARAERFGEKATGENPGLIYRRIQKLETDKRKMERNKAEAEAKHSQRGIEWANQWLTHLNNKLEVERAKYKASGGIATDNLQFKPGDIVYTRHGVGTIASISKKTARIKLDPDPRTGREIGIYPNAKGESLFSIERIKAKLTPQQIEEYNKNVQELKLKRENS
ncbi:MAG: DUF3560 domain-containing protein [Candidatus Bathyarchaeia archaeon]|jgi:hypothetical protein